MRSGAAITEDAFSSCVATTLCLTIESFESCACCSRWGTGWASPSSPCWLAARPLGGCWRAVLAWDWCNEPLEQADGRQAAECLNVGPHTMCHLGVTHRAPCGACCHSLARNLWWVALQWACISGVKISEEASKEPQNRGVVCAGNAAPHPDHHPTAHKAAYAWFMLPMISSE